MLMNDMIICMALRLQLLRAFHFKDSAAQTLDNPAVVSVIKPELIWQLTSARDMTQQQVRLPVSVHCYCCRNGCTVHSAVLPVLWRSAFAGGFAQDYA